MLAEDTDNMYQQFLAPELVSITTDGGKNFKGIAKVFDVVSIYCHNHVLNLVLQVSGAQTHNNTLLTV